MRIRGLLSLVLVAGLVACGTSEQEIAEVRERAWAYAENEQWDEAKIEFLNLLRLAPQDAESQHRMGEVLFELQEFRDGLWRFKEAVRQQPDNNEWRLSVAQVEFAARAYDQSLENVDQVLEREPRHVDALLLRSGLRSVKGDLEAQLEDIDRALEIEPDHKTALALKAQALGRKGDIAGAEEFLRKLLDVEATTSNWLTMARFLATLGRQEDAFKASEKAIEAADGLEERIRAQLHLANLHLNAGDNESTLDVLLQARTEAPEDPGLLLTLARFYYASGESGKAEEILEQHVDGNPESAAPLLVLADYYRLQGEPDRALSVVERALQIDPESETGLLRKAEYLYDDKSKRPEAWETVQGVLERNPKSSLGLFTEGKFHLMDGDYERSATSLRRVLDDQPSANAHVLLGSAYQAMKQLDLARSEFLQALQLDAQNHHARVQLSALYLRNDENDLAAREAGIALKLRPDDVRLRLIHAGALSRLSRLAEAREALEPLGLADGMAPDVRLQLARLYRTSNDLPTARKILDELMDDPGDRLGSMVQAEVIATDIQARDPAGAISRISGWIDESPDDPNLYLFRGRVRLGLTKAGRPAQPVMVEEDLRAAIDKGLDNIKAHMLLAQLYLRTERTEDAIATYLDARKRDPDDTAVPFQLAGVYEREGRLDEAREMYEQVLRLDQDQPVVKNNLAWLLVNQNAPPTADLDRAMELAQDAKEALPNNPSVADTLGWIMYKKDIPSAAISLFHEAIAAYPEAHPLRGTVRFHLAKAYQSNGDVERAIAELSRALDEVPSFAEREQTRSLLAELRSQ